MESHRNGEGAQRTGIEDGMPDNVLMSEVDPVEHSERNADPLLRSAQLSSVSKDAHGVGSVVQPSLVVLQLEVGDDVLFQLRIRPTQNRFQGMGVRDVELA